MIGPAADSVILGALLALVIEVVSLRFARRRPTGEILCPFPTLAVGLLITWLVFAWLGEARYGLEKGNGSTALIGAFVGGLIMLGAGLMTERTRPSSRRHFSAVVLGGISLTVGGLGVPHLTLPFMGTADLSQHWMLLITIAWVFLVTGLFEVLGVIPVLSGVAGLLAGSVMLLPVGFFHSFAGFVLCGSMLGVLLGRFVGQLFSAQSRSSGIAEVLVLGYTASAATLTVFAKSVVIASFIIPIGAIATVLVLLLMHSLGGSLVLRQTPR